MNAFFDRILTLNLVGTTVVFYVAARIYLWPHLHRLSPRSVMIPILLLHSLRHLGLMFLTRGATYPGLSREFAWPAASGDLIAQLPGFREHEQIVDTDSKTAIEFREASTPEQLFAASEYIYTSCDDEHLEQREKQFQCY